MYWLFKNGFKQIFSNGQPLQTVSQYCLWISKGRIPKKMVTIKWKMQFIRSLHCYLFQKYVSTLVTTTLQIIQVWISAALTYFLLHHSCWDFFCLFSGLFFTNAWGVLLFASMPLTYNSTEANKRTLHTCSFTHDIEC